MPEPTEGNPLGRLPDHVADKKTAATDIIIPGKGGTADIRFRPEEVEKETGPQDSLSTRVRKTVESIRRAFTDPDER